MNTKVYIYRSHIDGTFYATTSPLSQEQISDNALESKELFEGCIKNKEDLRKFLATWEGVCDEMYLKCFARQVKNLMYNENK